MTLAVATAFERVHSEKHYASDVIASAFISLLASEGVRYASNYDKNHLSTNGFLNTISK